MSCVLCGFHLSEIFLRWPAMCIHGDKSQPEREWVLKGMIFVFCCSSTDQF